jgi:DNA topoisomerase-1
LTTLRDTHVEVNGRCVRFTFKGKSGVEHEIALDDRRLARIVKQCRDLPGYDLFQYIDDEGGRQTIESADVNAYLRSVSGDDYSSKDFRTWAGTVLATELLRDLERFQTECEAKKQIVSAVDSVAKRLGNTKAVCRKCYIHPAVFEAFMDGSLVEVRARVTRRTGALSEPEAAVLAMLQRRLRAATDRRAS